jgi:hypothetical protein
MPAYGTADIEVLLSVCRGELRPAETSDDIRLDDNAWRRVLAAALEHGLIGPLHAAVSRVCSVPDHILRSVETAYLTQAARNFQLVAALSDILGTFAELNIDVAVFKGPAAALIAFGQIAHREFNDLDLLVRPDNLNRARLALQDLGYRQISADVSNLNDQKDLEFLRDADQSLVELHWCLNPPNQRFPLEDTGVWDRLQTVYFQNHPIRTLSLEDTVISLCIHASTHRWSRLKWVLDIARIVSFNEELLDWDIVTERCAIVGCNRTLLFAIRIASLLFETRIPPPVAAQMSKNVSLMELAEDVRNSLLQIRPLTEAEVIKCDVEIHDRCSDRLFIATLPFPHLPRILPAVMSPITKGPLRFVTRPIRLLLVYGFDWFRTAIVRR